MKGLAILLKFLLSKMNKISNLLKTAKIPSILDLSPIDMPLKD